jgi:hypothetical protein
MQWKLDDNRSARLGSKLSYGIQVAIGSMVVKKSDLGVKTTTLPAVMTKAAQEFFEKQSGLTIKRPSGKPDSGFEVSESVISLKKETKGSRQLILCTVSFALSRLPNDKPVPGKLVGHGTASVSRDVKGDAELAVATGIKEVSKLAVEQIKHATN